MLICCCCSFPSLHEKPGAVDGLCVQSLVYVSLMGKEMEVGGGGGFAVGVCVGGGGLRVAGA